jgi:hypothetical protein
VAETFRTINHNATQRTKTAQAQPFVAFVPLFAERVVSEKQTPHPNVPTLWAKVGYNTKDRSYPEEQTSMTGKPRKEAQHHDEP